MANRVEPTTGQGDGKFQEMKWEVPPPFDYNAPGQDGLNDNDIQQAGCPVTAYAPAQFGPGEEFRLELDSPCCLAGTPFTGRLLINNQNPMTQIGTMMVTVQGVAMFKWKEAQHYRDRNGRRRTRYIPRSHQESILTLPVTVKQFGSVTQLPEGVTEEKFTVLLPPTALPSIRTPRHCIIFYTMQAQMQIIQPVNTQLFSTRELKVVAAYDLNQANVTLERLDLANQKSVGMVCCSGNLSVHVQLEKTGLVPGEKVPMHITVDNNYKRQLALSFKLTQSIGMVIQGHVRRQENKLVSTQQLAVIEPYNRNFQLSLYFMVPPCSAQFATPMLTMAYFLNIEAKHIGGMHFALDLDAPLIVGNIPDQHTYATFSSADPTTAALNPQSLANWPGAPMPTFAVGYDGSNSLFYNPL